MVKTLRFHHRVQGFDSRLGKIAKWLSEEGLQIAVKRREAKGKGEKEKYTHLNAEFQSHLCFAAVKAGKIWAPSGWLHFEPPRPRPASEVYVHVIPFLSKGRDA